MMWDPEVLWQVMTCCVILHNMIVEDEGEGAARTDFEKPGEHVHLPEQDAEYVMHFLEMHRQLRDEQVHTQLLHDLVEHMYVFMGKQ